MQDMGVMPPFKGDTYDRLALVTWALNMKAPTTPCDVLTTIHSEKGGPPPELASVKCSEPPTAQVPKEVKP